MIRPELSAVQNRAMSAVVVHIPPSPVATTGRYKTLVRHWPLDLDVDQCRPAAQSVGAKEFGVGHACGGTDQLAHQIEVGAARDTLREQGEHHKAAVAVGEPVTGPELHLVAVGGDPIGDMCSCTIFHAPSSLTSTIVVCWSAETGLPREPRCSGC